MGPRNRPQVGALAICFQVLRPEFWAVVPRPPEFWAVLQLFAAKTPATP